MRVRVVDMSVITLSDMVKLALSVGTGTTILKVRVVEDSVTTLVEIVKPELGGGGVPDPVAMVRICVELSSVRVVRP